MQGTAVVDSGEAMTRRRLREAGFGDEQVQTLVEVTGADRAFRIEMQREVAAVHSAVDGLRSEFSTRFDGARDEVNARFAGARDEVNARFEGVNARFDGVNARFDSARDEFNARFDGARDEMNARFEGFRGEVNARFDGLDGRLRLILWFMGVGLTLYTGTTVSLMILLFRDLLS